MGPIAGKCTNYVHVIVVLTQKYKHLKFITTYLYIAHNTGITFCSVVLCNR